MSRNLDSPVKTQMAVAVHNGALGGEFHANQRLAGKPAGKKRIFVQTDTGSVLGIELDRRDNVHMVKRKMQLALHVPTEGSSLTFGDLVLKNDLSTVRNAAALRLTKNVMHRSSSTPCLSPSSSNLQHRDRSGPVEILCFSDKCSRTKQLVKDVVKAIKSGVEPVPVHSGLGGAYFFRNTNGESVAIIKPTDEEPFAPNNPKGFVGKALGQPGLKKSVRVGETGIREVAAYLLDYDNFANVPPTILVKITHSVFCINGGVNGGRSQDRKQVSKIASFQQFVPHDSDAGDLGTSSFPVSSVHRIGILDIRILNTDRHSGNLLVRRKLDTAGRFGQVELIPIDHGMCLPEDLEDPYFEWLHWPQASVPFSQSELEYIANLDPCKDAELLRSELPMLREACLRVLIVCTIFLKEAAAFGLCLAEIGGMMSRDFHGLEEEPSELEVVCLEARKLLAEQGSFFDDLEAEEREEDDSDQFQFHIDCEEDSDEQKPLKVDRCSQAFVVVGASFIPKTNLGLQNFAALSFPSPKGGCCRSSLSRLDESPEDDDLDIIEEEEPLALPSVRKLSVCNLSQSFKSLGIGDKYQRGGSIFSGGPMGAGNRRSAEEQVQVASSFVKFSDMALEEWEAFLHKFQELLQVAFEVRKEKNIHQRKRLGTSCQF